MSAEAKDYAEVLLKVLYGGEARDYTKFDVERMAYLLATISSAQLFIKEFPRAPNYVSRAGVLQNALAACSIPGLYLEFGVASGWSIKVISATTTEMVHGFDSFEGLPEDWTHVQKAGRFSTGGKPLQGLPANTMLHVGWFDATLPKFLVDHAGNQPIRFLHVDSDLYSSAKTVLNLLGDRIVSGTVIVFDDFFNYPNWENGEAKAWQEFVAYKHLKVEYIGWAGRASSVAVRVT